MSDPRTLLEAAVAAARSRTSWNSWLESAEKPASDHEETKIMRAATLAANIVNNNTWMLLQGASVRPQGSYFNNTNVRLEADMDLRVEVPHIKVEYLFGVLPAETTHIMTYTDGGRSYAEINSDLRSTLEADLVKNFGRANVDSSGQKAIKVHGLDGSRADCDLVPTFALNVFMKDRYGLPYMVRGVAILERMGGWTYNFPEQHHDNGIAKRFRTSHRFKRNVRMLKRLNYELEALGDIPRRIPSFFVECLVYLVEDEFFLVETDDRYDRILRILYWLRAKLNDPAWCDEASEVNEIKLLFRNNFAWTSSEALNFVNAAIKRLAA
jgi:hypothetical protein